MAAYKVASRKKETCIYHTQKGQPASTLMYREIQKEAVQLFAGELMSTERVLSETCKVCTPNMCLAESE